MLLYLDFVNEYEICGLAASQQLKLKVEVEVKKKTEELIPSS